MRAVIQRVAEARVVVDGAVVGEIAGGLCVFVGAVQGDTAGDAEFIARKLVALRIFEDDQERMNLSVQQTGGSVLLISQFTLCADTTSGSRPSFSKAMDPAEAEPLLKHLVAAIALAGVPIQTGWFGARMEVKLHNSGPVTILLDSQAKVRK